MLYFLSNRHASCEKARRERKSGTASRENGVGTHRFPPQNILWPESESGEEVGDSSDRQQVTDIGDGDGTETSSGEKYSGQARGEQLKAEL